EPDCGPRSNMCTQPVAPCGVLTLVHAPLRSLLRVTTVLASSGATLAPLSAGVSRNWVARLTTADSCAWALPRVPSAADASQAARAPRCSHFMVVLSIYDFPVLFIRVDHGLRKAGSGKAL